MKRLLITILFILLMPSICLSYEHYELRFDPYINTSTNSICTKTVYNLLNDQIDKTDIPLTFKTLFSGALSPYLMLLGHEYSHGEILRRLNIDHSYKLKILSLEAKTYYQDLNVSLPVKNFLYINGIRFEKDLRDIAKKEQIMHGINYKNSTLLLWLFESKFSNTKHAVDNNYSNDYYIFSKSLQSINPSTDLSLKNIKKTVFVSMLDPLSLLSTWCCLSSLFNYENNYKITTMPSVDFNLYPQAVTYELAFLKKFENKYIKASMEYGEDVFNNNVYGGALEVTNICKINNITLDFKIHCVKNCIGTIEPAINYKNTIVGVKYNVKKISEIENKVEMFIGCKF